jgi:hypothetical protein
MLTAVCPPRAGGSSPSPGPRRAPPRPGPVTAPATSSAASSSDPSTPSAPFPSRPSWSPCCAATTGTAPRTTGGCSPAAAAGCSARAPTARAWQQGPHPRPRPPVAATGLPRRPYDLRHAALSLWLDAGAPPAQIAARAGHSVAVLLSTYAHCIDGQDEITNRQIEHALSTQNRPPDRTASGATNRRSRPDPVRHMSASGSHHAPRPARRPPCTRRAMARPRPAGTRVPQVRDPLSISCEREDLAHPRPTGDGRRSA